MKSDMMDWTEKSIGNGSNLLGAGIAGADGIAV